MPARPKQGGRAARPIVIGLAGGIGAGKSAAAGALASLGCLVLDADREAKAALRRPDVRDALVGWWGASVLDAAGAIDPPAVARIVFADEAQRKRLEALVHPIVVRAHDESIADAARRAVGCVVIDAPLLFEAGLDTRCDAVIFIDAPPEERRRRAATRGWGPGELDLRENSQMPLEIKRRRADYVVVNDAGQGELLARLRDVLEAIKLKPARRQGRGSAG